MAAARLRLRVEVPPRGHHLIVTYPAGKRWAFAGGIWLPDDWVAAARRDGVEVEFEREDEHESE
jgi:hypothetical protein